MLLSSKHPKLGQQATTTSPTSRRAAAIQRHTATLAATPTLTLVQYANALEARPTMSRTAAYVHERIMNALVRRGIMAMNGRSH